MSRVEVHRITSAQPGPSADLVHRERQYLFLMGMRMVAIVVAVVVTDSGRPHPRIGGLTVAEIKGEDGLR